MSRVGVDYHPVWVSFSPMLLLKPALFLVDLVFRELLFPCTHLALDILSGADVWLDVVPRCDGLEVAKHDLSTGCDVLVADYVDDICRCNSKDAKCGVVRLGTHCQTCIRASSKSPYRTNAHLSGLHTFSGRRLRLCQGGSH